MKMIIFKMFAQLHVCGTPSICPPHFHQIASKYQQFATSHQPFFRKHKPGWRRIKLNNLFNGVTKYQIFVMCFSASLLIFCNRKNWIYLLTWRGGIQKIPVSSFKRTIYICCFTIKHVFETALWSMKWTLPSPSPSPHSSYMNKASMDMLYSNKAIHTCLGSIELFRGAVNASNY